ncbi:MAG: rhomboid family intramembrane serine protease [Planctomycetes bacterium]|nr:rhomboid family intramembrane serine protease [Planctomycetota bacterium]
MLILFPYRVDVPFNYRPAMNWIMVALIIFVFLIQMTETSQVRNRQMSRSEYLEKSLTMQYMLDDWSIKGLFGHMWLHGGLWHLIGNLIFLWLFGNAVCSKIGNLFYLPIYVILGMIAGISHLLFFSDIPVLGASGAINGIVGMYLVFFPENSISCFLWFIFCFMRPFWFSVRSFWMILLWFAFDILGAMSGSGGVAYLAHIGGFVAGVGLAIFMLRTKMIVMERDETSILKLLGMEKKEKSQAQMEDLIPRQREWGNKKINETEQKTIKFEPDDKPVQFIRLKCRCGQPIKVPRQYAGKIGRCPKCSAKWRIPEL